MRKILIITYPETASGFSLTGVDVMGLEKEEDLSEIIYWLLQEKTYALVAVEDAFLSSLDNGIRRRLDREGKPVIVSISTPKRWAVRGEAETYLARLIRRAIGYQIKIKH